MLLSRHARTRHKRAVSCVHATSGCIAPLAALGCCKPGHVRAFSNVLLCHLLQRWAEFSRSFASAKELVALLRRPTHGQTLRLTCTGPICTCAGACQCNVFGACHPWRGACSRPSVPGWHVWISRSWTQNGPRYPCARAHGLPLHVTSTPLCGWSLGSPCVPVGNG